jgi:hypothetical protein
MRINPRIHARTTAAVLVAILVLPWTSPAQAEDYGRTQVSPGWMQLNIDRKPRDDEVPAVVYGYGVPAGFAVSWSEYLDAGPTGSSLLKCIGRISAFSTDLTVDEQIGPIVTDQIAAEPAERLERAGSEPELLPIEWFTPSEAMPVATSVTCCWTPVANRLIYRDSPSAIRISSDAHYLVEGTVYWSAGKVYWEDIYRGWTYAYSTSQMIIDCDAVVSACDEYLPGPLVIAAACSDVTGFVSYVAVTRKGEYRFGMVSTDGKLYPTRPASVNAVKREIVEQCAVKLFRDYASPFRTMGAEAATTSGSDPRSIAADSQRALTGTIGEAPHCSERLTDPASLSRILPRTAVP